MSSGFLHKTAYTFLNAISSPNITVINQIPREYKQFFPALRCYPPEWHVVLYSIMLEPFNMRQLATVSHAYKLLKF